VVRVPSEGTLSMELLSDEEIEARLAALEAPPQSEVLTDSWWDGAVNTEALVPNAAWLDGMKPPSAAEVPQHEERDTKPKPKRYRYIKPFVDAADDLIDLCVNTEGRWMFGLPGVDAMVRGVSPGDLMYVTGRSHSGKTQIILQSIANNPGARVLFFTPDEVDVMVLTKLVAMVRGIDGESLERRIREGDEEAIDAVTRTARDDFKNLIVIDEALTFDQMTLALNEAEEHWGADANVVFYDFLELSPEGENVNEKSKRMKLWAKGVGRPTIVLRQNSRSSGNRGQAAGLSGMSYGGENEAIFVLEVFRKLEDTGLEEWERDQIRDTVTINVAKNKRPPCKKGEVDLFMDPNTGAVRPLRPGDGGHRVRTPMDALAQARNNNVYGTQESF
jgi:KaiC/GvpD/RAD55 family RecA-like ATPase